MEKNSRGLSDILSTATIAILFLVIILMVVFSAVSYQHITETQQENNNSRAVLSYVVSAVKDNAGGQLSIEDFSGDTGLAIRDGETGYERKIYHHEGRILEEYGSAGTPVVPEDALIIGETDTFELEMTGNVLQIVTDQGTTYVSTVGAGN